MSKASSSGRDNLGGSEPTVSVIIPTRNRRDKLVRCVGSVCKSTYPSIEVVVVDDASDYEVAPDMEQFRPHVKVIRNKTRKLLSYSRNIGAYASRGEFLFFLDDDNVIAPNAIDELLKSYSSETIVVCSPVIYRYDNPATVWTSYIRKGRFPGFYVLSANEPEDIVNTFTFHDAFMVRRSAFEKLGGFDDKTYPIHFSELDFAYRVQHNGFTAKVNPKARVWHDVGRVHMHVDSVRSFFTLRNRIILLRRYVSRREFLVYVTTILPLLTAYYVIHHMRYAPDHRFLASYNLLRGVVSALAFRERFRLQTLESSIVKPWGRREVRYEGPLVSVVVPTKNSETTIGRCLKSLINQSYGNLEIIVVDNSSEDKTVQIAKSFKKVTVLSHGPERSAQINFGARHAKGKYVYRVDSDFVLEQNVIEEAVRKCVEEGYKVVTIHNTSDPSISFWSKVRKLERDCYEDDEVHIAARFFDKEVFQYVGGFDEELVASEDYDLHNRLVRKGFKIGRIKAKELHVGEPKRLTEIVEKHIYYGKLIDAFIRQNPGISIRQLSPIRVAYFRHWRYFVNNPKLTAGFLVYQYIRYISAIVGYLAAKI